MLAQKNRIPKSEFPSPKDRGVRLFSTLFSGTAYPQTKESKFAVVVSKKIAKTAVTRNRTRRKFYAAIEALYKKIKNPVSIVLFPKNEAIGATTAVIHNEIIKELKKLKLL